MTTAGQCTLETQPVDRAHGLDRQQLARDEGLAGSQLVQSARLAEHETQHRRRVELGDHLVARSWSSTERLSVGAGQEPPHRIDSTCTTCYTYGTWGSSQVATKQNLTIQLDRETIRKAKVLAAKRGTSIGGLVAAQIRESVQADDAYELARRAALELLERGFHLGGDRPDRNALHER